MRKELQGLESRGQRRRRVREDTRSRSRGGGGTMRDGVSAFLQGKTWSSHERSRVFIEALAHVEELRRSEEAEESM